MAIAAFEAGKHVICEKPLACSPRTARRWSSASKKARQDVHDRLQQPVPRRHADAEEIHRGGELGEIYFAKTGWIRRKGIPGMGGWFTQKAKAGGGPLIDIGVHVLDLTLWLMGNPKAVSVSGSTYCEVRLQGRGHGRLGNIRVGRHHATSRTWRAGSSSSRTARP